MGTRKPYRLNAPSLRQVLEERARLAERRKRPKPRQTARELQAQDDEAARVFVNLPQEQPESEALRGTEKPPRPPDGGGRPKCAKSYGSVLHAI